MALRPIELRAKLFVSRSPRGMPSALEIDRSLRAIRWMLLGVVQASEEWMLLHPETPGLYESGVVYKREVDSEIWQDVATTLERGFGDCEDLTIYRCAELRTQGIPAQPYITGKRGKGHVTYHATVMWPNGLIEDPSRALGMTGAITRRPVFI